MFLDLGHSSLVGHLPSNRKALVSIPRTAKKFFNFSFYHPSFLSSFLPSCLPASFLSSFLSFLFIFLFVTGSHYVAQADLEIVLFLPQLP
jgi:hypothetical protein